MYAISKLRCAARVDTTNERKEHSSTFLTEVFFHWDNTLGIFWSVIVREEDEFYTMLLFLRYSIKFCSCWW